MEIRSGKRDDGRSARDTARKPGRLVAFCRRIANALLLVRDFSRAECARSALSSVFHVDTVVFSRIFLRRTSRGPLVRMHSRDLLARYRLCCGPSTLFLPMDRRIDSSGRVARNPRASPRRPVKIARLKRTPRCPSRPSETRARAQGTIQSQQFETFPISHDVALYRRGWG